MLLAIESMMVHKPYLIFSLQDSLYGIDALLVQEVFYLPELTSVIGAPQDIVGIINLRGKIVPIMDLNLRFGYPAQKYRLSDSVVVLKYQELLIGIIVNQVHEVKNLDWQTTEAQIAYGREQSVQSQFMLGIAKTDTEMITLLNHEKLISHPDSLQALSTSSHAPSTAQPKAHDPAGIATKPRDLYLDLTAEEWTIFRERAANLMQSSQDQDASGLMALAVVGICGEYFALDLKTVREFTDVRNVTPIPCCPPYIVGNMNLRGEIVTLVDIRHVLNLAKGSAQNSPKAMVVHVGDVVAGVTVDAVFDVTYLLPSSVKPVPTAVHSEGTEYLLGTATYSDKMMSILDLSKILMQGALVVDQEV